MCVRACVCGMGVQLTPAHWEAMKGMEAARKLRMPAGPAGAAAAARLGDPSGGAAAALSLSEQLANLQGGIGDGPEDDGSAARMAASIAAMAEEQDRTAGSQA
jgi:hypothetical protein